MKLFGQTGSAAFDSVRIALNLKEIEYERVVIDASHSADLKLPERLRAMSPALAPVLVDQQRMFIETLAIIEYIDESYPQPALLPGAARDRSQIRTLAELIVSNLHPFINLRMQEYLDTAAIDRDEWHQKWINDGLNLLETVITNNTARGRFCHGDDPTMADVCLVPEIWAGLRLGLELSPYPSVEQIYTQCMALDVFSAVALDLS